MRGAGIRQRGKTYTLKNTKQDEKLKVQCCSVLSRDVFLVNQGHHCLTCREAVAWFDESNGRQTGLARIDLFARGEVRISRGSARSEMEESAYLRMQSHVGLVLGMTVLRTLEEPPDAKLWDDALSARLPSRKVEAKPPGEPAEEGEAWISAPLPSL